MAKILDKIIKTCLYLLVFLLPLFWLPFSFEAFEFNKQYLLFFLVSLSFFAWLAKMVLVDKEIRLRKSPLDIFVLVFLFIAILSAVFSVDKNSSIFGFYGRFSDGLIGLLSLGVLYFLITNNVGGDKGVIRDVKGVLKVFLWSVFLVVLISYFSIFGIWQRIAQIGPIGQIGLPPVMLQPAFNPVAGSMEGLVIFLSIIIVLIVGLLLWTRFRLGQLAYLGLLVLGLGLLILIDYNLTWIVLLVSLSLFLVFALVKRIFRESVNRLLLPISLIIIAAVFLFVNIAMPPGGVEIPREQVLGQGISWLTAIGAATENIKSGFLGSGIGTFHYAFAKHKPLEINETWLWQIRFDRPGSHLAEILGTMGFLGILSYLVLIGMFLLVSWLLLKDDKGVLKDDKGGLKNDKGELKDDKGEDKFPILMVFLALLVGQLVYYQNIALAFTFWLVLGLAAVSSQPPTNSWWGKDLSFKDFPELSLIFSTLVIVLGIVILGLYYFGVRFYLADVNYNKGLAVLGEDRIEKLEKAVSLNPRLPQYRLALSRDYLFEALAEARKPPAEQDLVKIETMVARAIDEARMATILQPNSVVNWENSGIIYREIMGIAAGAAEWSIKSFERAIDLEPTNPVLYTELGKLYLLGEDSQKAREYFQKALEKKSDYADAIIQEALLLEREDVLDEAITKLENLIVRDPWNVEAHFQLGRLYYNVGRIDEAIELFEAVTRWVPNHSNALYSLGIAYQRKDQKEKAIYYFERVLELIPGNQDVIQKLEELRK